MPAFGIPLLPRTEKEYSHRKEATRPICSMKDLAFSHPNGLLYMRARYYNPFLCRFLNPDPSGFAAGLNFYAYANGNPASMTDPMGLDAVNENLQPPSWTEAPTPQQQQMAQFYSGILNLATVGGANFLSSAVSGRDILGNEENVNDAFQDTLKTAALVASVVTALPTDGASLEADAVLEGADVGLGDLAAGSSGAAGGGTIPKLLAP